MSNMLKKTTKEKTRIFFFFMMIILTIAALGALPRIAIPLVISYVLTLILNPLNQILMKFGLTRTLSSFLLLVGILFLSIYPVVKLVPVLTDETQNIQYYIPKIETYVKQEYFVVKAKVKDKVGFELQDRYISDALSYVRSGVSSVILNLPKVIASIVEWIFVIPLFVFFMLKDIPGFRKFILRITPNSLFEKFYYLSHQFNKQLGGYILAKFIEASIIGVIITSGLLIIDIRFAVLFGLLAAVTNVIPYLGPILGSIPAIIFVLVEYGGSSTTFAAVTLLFIIANAIDIAIVFPILVSKIVNLHPVVVVASVILGSQLLGIVGMIISIPVAAAIKLVFQEIFEDIYSIHS